VSKNGATFNDRVIVIGLGRFGRSVARTLHELGYQVTAIDLNARNVEEASGYLALAAEGDGSDEELLQSLQVERSAVGIVAQGRNLEANILSALILKKSGVPWVAAKATSELHGELLRRIGVDRVVFPERDEGVRLAHAIAVPSINDYISLSVTSGVAKVVAPGAFVGRALKEIYASSKAQVGVFLIKRGNTLITSPPASETIQAGDELVLAGPDRDIERFVELDPSRD
jgi:trk system potassium uptake protein TrkA